MRILMLNNKYLLHGGEEVVFGNEVDLLRANGCEVDTFVVDNTEVAKIGKLRTGINALWSTDMYRQMRRRLQEKQYDVVHVHNYFPLFSPSVYYAAHAEGVPVVQTLHNYRLLCPVGTFFRDGRVCEDCLGKRIPWRGVYHACYRNSRCATAAVASMLALHRALGTWQKMIDAYIVLTRFELRKISEGGLPANKAFIKPNFLADPPPAGPGGGGYAVFIGRICEEKGIRTLLKAWRKIGSRLPLKILGTGPMVAEVEETVRRLEGVEYLGFQQKERIYELVGEAECVVVPSQWYEGQPVVVIEALALGTPLILSDIGPMSEFIDHEESGLLFESGNADDLVAKVDWFLENRANVPDMRKRVRFLFDKRHAPNRNFEIFMDIYHAAMRRAAGVVENDECDALSRGLEPAK